MTDIWEQADEYRAWMKEQPVEDDRLFYTQKEEEE